MTVVPLEIFAWRLYALPVISWAIALFGLDQLRAGEVRRLASPDAFVACGSEWRWRQLTRWIDWLGESLSIRALRRRDRAREIALRVAARCGAMHALNSGSAWIGAAMSIAS